jgi:hypothetical protein
MHGADPPKAILNGAGTKPLKETGGARCPIDEESDPQHLAHRSSGVSQRASAERRRVGWRRGGWGRLQRQELAITQPKDLGRVRPRNRN